MEAHPGPGQHECPAGASPRTRQGPPAPAPELASPSPDGALFTAIERIVEAFPGYGYRRVTKQLQRDGCCVNHKRVQRLMREAGLLLRWKRRFVRTTDSRHSLPIFPNLLVDRGWRGLTAPNQDWVADLTYVYVSGKASAIWLS